MGTDPLVTFNKDFGLTTKEGVYYETATDWVWYEVLGGCGCGNSDRLGARVAKILQLFATPHDQRTWTVYDTPGYEALAHWIDSKGLTEHGSSIGGAWLSEEGKEVYAVLVESGELEDLCDGD